MRRKRSPNSPIDPQGPLIRLSRVSRFYRPDKPALFDVSFDIYPGELLYVAGPSGAGKSTLLRLLHGEEHPDTGAVVFAGCNLADLKRPAISILRRSMGMVFQDYRLIPDLSVMANVALPLEVAGYSRSAITAKVNKMLEKVGLPGRSSESAGELSGGEQQRVAIARALVTEPEVVLADEPTGSLDAYNADFVLDLLEDAAQRGAAVVLATHDKMLMAARPHRTIAFTKGRVVGLSPNKQQQRKTGAPDTKGPYKLKQTG